MTTFTFRPIAAIALTIASAAATCQFSPVDKYEDGFDPAPLFWTISPSTKSVILVGCKPDGWQQIRIFVPGHTFDGNALV